MDCTASTSIASPIMLFCYGVGKGAGNVIPNNVAREFRDQEPGKLQELGWRLGSFVPFWAGYTSPYLEVKLCLRSCV